MSRAKDFRFINLAEIPDDGREFIYNRQTGDLNEILADILGDRAYQVRLYIRPMGNAYEMTGEVRTQIAEICSLCGWDIELPLARRVNEILIPQGDSYRKEQSVHGNQAVDFLTEGRPSVSEYQGNSFDAGEFVHEAIAINTPAYPNCGDADCEHLKEVSKIREGLEAEVQALEKQKAPGHPGFAALKDLKLKS
jgi:uncharacterized protein